MSILALASAGSSPGVTTLAVALTLQWPRPCLLTEADVSKPSSVIPGLLQGAMPPDTGLMGIAQASSMEPLTDTHIFDFAVDLHTQLGTDNPDTPRLLLPALSEPAGARRMRSFWSDLLRVLRGLEAQPVDSVIDLGRIEDVHGRDDLVSDSDHLCLITRSDLGSVAAVKAWLPELEAQRASRGAGATISVVVVEDVAQKVESREIAKYLGVPVMGRIPHVSQAAAFYSGGARVSRRGMRALDSAVAGAGASLVQAMDKRRAVMEGETL